MADSGSQPITAAQPTKAEIDAIPFCMGYDEASHKLTLRSAQYIPKEVYDFAAKYTIEILDASIGTISALPDDFGKKLPDLKIAFFSDNNFQSVPKALAGCPKLETVAFKSNGITEFPENALPTSLRWLILTDNKITKLPDSIGNLTKLEKVALVGNQLSSVPESMQNCKKIGLLRLSANNFTSPPPAWLMQLPKLTWYSDGGNPFCTKPSIECETIAHGSLTIGERLNGSPSSDVYAATQPPHTNPLAVKIFKGEVTSDGWPADDMRASLAAGKHPNIIPILGQLTGAPDGKQGLVMERIGDDWQSLGKPPSLSTILRDTFPDGRRFSPSYIRKALSGVASAMKHLHDNNIAHGDLYAHNILAAKDGSVKVGDFGAATIYPPEERPIREALDVRAFGILIEDMLKQLPEHIKRLPPHMQSDEITELKTLCDRCKSSDANARPSFETIVDELSKEKLRKTLKRGSDGQNLGSRSL